MKKSLSMLVHGQSGAGKSLFMASMPAPRIIIDVEHSARFLPLNAVTAPDPTQGFTYPSNIEAIKEVIDPKNSVDTLIWPADDWDSIDIVIKSLRTGNHPFVSIGLDSFMEAQARAVEAIAHREQVKIQDWGAIYRYTGSLARDLRDLCGREKSPIVAVVATCPTKVSEDGISYPHLQGQAKTLIPYVFDMAAYLDQVASKQGEYRMMYTRKTNRYFAKTRISSIPPELKLPQVVGDTLEEEITNNTAFQSLMALAYSHNKMQVVATDDTPSDFNRPLVAPMEAPQS